MVDIIILLIVLVILIFAVKGTIRHFRGEGGCCGGSKGRIKTETKKPDSQKIGEKRIQIQGMHCECCAEKVSNALNQIEGVTATVNLKQAEAIIAYDREIDDNTIRTIIENAGYKIKKM